MLAVQQKAVAFGGEMCSVFEVSDCLRSTLTAGVAEDLALQDQLDPAVVVVADVVDSRRLAKSFLYEPVVGAQDVRDDGIGLGEVDDDSDGRRGGCHR